DQRHRHRVAVFGEDAAHAAFLSNQSDTHLCFLQSVNAALLLAAPLSEGGDPARSAGWGLWKQPNLQRGDTLQNSTEFDLNIHAGGEVELHQRVHGLVVWVNDVEHALVGTRLV